MIGVLYNHFYLFWGLTGDKHVSLWHMLLIFRVPVHYAAVPFLDDVLPDAGFLDEPAMLGLCTFVFVAASPSGVVAQHKQTIINGMTTASMGGNAYRYAEQSLDLVSWFKIIIILLIQGGWYMGILGGILHSLGYLTTCLMHTLVLGNGGKVTPLQLSWGQRALEPVLAYFSLVQGSRFVIQNSIIISSLFIFPSGLIVESFDAISFMEQAERKRRASVIAEFCSTHSFLYTAHTDVQLSTD